MNKLGWVSYIYIYIFIYIHNVSSLLGIGKSVLLQNAVKILFFWHWHEILPHYPGTSPWCTKIVQGCDLWPLGMSCTMHLLPFETKKKKKSAFKYSKYTLKKVSYDIWLKIVWSSNLKMIVLVIVSVKLQNESRGKVSFQRFLPLVYFWVIIFQNRLKSTIVILSFCKFG